MAHWTQLHTWQIGQDRLHMNFSSSGTISVVTIFLNWFCWNFLGMLPGAQAEFYFLIILLKDKKFI